MDASYSSESSTDASSVSTASLENLPLLIPAQNTPLIQHRENHRRQVLHTHRLIILSVVLLSVGRFTIITTSSVIVQGNGFCWTAVTASSLIFVYYAIRFTTCWLGGWISDAFIGQKIVLFLGYALVAAGWGAFVFISNDAHSAHIIGTNSTCSKAHTKQNIFICSGVLLATGDGFIYNSLVLFGADQAFSRSPQHNRFFNALYWGVNMGNLADTIFLIPWQLLMHGTDVPLFDNKLFGYATSRIILLSANFFAAFVCAFSLICVTAAVRRGVFVARPVRDLTSQTLTILSTSLSSVNRRRRASLRRHMDPEEVPSLLEMVKEQNGGSFDNTMVDNTRRYLYLALVFLSLVPYLILYNQLPSTFAIQGLQIEGYNYSSKATHQQTITTRNAVLWMSAADSLTLVLLIPLSEFVVRPLLARRGVSFSTTSKIGAGMVLASCSLLSAGILGTVMDRTVDLKNNVTSFWQVPQYVLMALSEMLTMISGYELAYTQAPVSMQGLVMGLFMFAQGLGAFLSLLAVGFAAYIDVICRDDSCYQEDGTQKKTQMDLYFYSLAAFQIFGFLLYLLIIRSYHRWHRTGYGAL